MGYGLKWEPWVVVVGCVFMQLAGGHIYLFGTYSNELKYVLFRDASDAQTRIQAMALAGNIGCYLPLSGLWHDTRFGGATTTAILGSLLTFPGYFLLYKAINGTDIPYAALLFICGLWGSGASFFNTSAIATSIRNFPHHRGMIIGLMASFFGLSASVLVQSYVTWFKPKPLEDMNGMVPPPAEQIENDVSGASNFLLFLSIGPPILAVLTVTFVSRTDPVPVSKRAATRFKACYTIIFTTAIVLLTSGIYTTASGIKKGSGHWTEDATMWTVVLLLSLFLLVPYKAYKKVPYKDLEEPAETSKEPGNEVKLSKEEEGPMDALRSVRFYLMFGSLFPVMGGGLMVLNNIAQILKAKDKSDANDVMVQLMSVFNCFARLLIGVVGDYFVHKFNRPVLLSFILVVMGVSHAMLALPVDFLVIPGACLAAFGYGCAWSTFPPLIAEIFGFGSFATLYSMFAMAACLGSLVFSTLLASKVYEHHTESGETDCYGNSCYQLTHAIICCACGIGFVCSLILNRLVSHIYRPRVGTEVIELHDGAVSEASVSSAKRVSVPSVITPILDEENIIEHVE
eukprot:TRINITY_DN16915_c0_g1_i1.p1 TRINITY_DN16915_c0_g1~~TRINITY_DN16915_c0_g1_i1.p1  ORF type:complete len:570 (+),score=52.31 TRINITY_DN16915_c0_g1_i1:42-1751(+)